MKEHILRPEIENFFEEQNFRVEVVEYSDRPILELQQYSPAGEDWYVELECSSVGSLIDELQRIYEGFDVDEEVRLWAENSGRNGVPDIETLLGDAKWKDNVLGDLAQKAKNELGYLESKDMFVKADLSKTIEEHPFSLDESSVEYQTDEPAFEMWVNTEHSDGFHENAFDDLFIRADFDFSDEDDLSEVPESLSELMDMDGHENAYVEATLRICADHTVRLYVKLVDDELEGFYGGTIPLTQEEQEAIFKMVEEDMGEERLALYLQTAAEKYQKPVLQKSPAQEYAEKNFYDNEDLVRSYLKAASVGEVLNFIGEDAYNVTASSLMDTAEEVLAQMPDEELQQYADEYTEKAFAWSVKGQKAQDALAKKKEEAERSLTHEQARGVEH